MRISDWSSDVCSSDLGEGMKAIADAIAAIAERPDIAVIFPVHPNPHVRSIMTPILGDLPNVALIDPLDYPHFVRLLGESDLVLTDSGGVQEEAPALGKPVLVMRSEEHTSELQSLMRTSYAVFCLKKKKKKKL